MDGIGHEPGTRDQQARGEVEGDRCQPTAPRRRDRIDPEKRSDTGQDQEEPVVAGEVGGAAQSSGQDDPGRSLPARVTGSRQNDQRRQADRQKEEIRGRVDRELGDFSTNDEEDLGPDPSSPAQQTPEEDGQQPPRHDRAGDREPLPDDKQVLSRRLGKQGQGRRVARPLVGVLREGPRHQARRIRRIVVVEVCLRGIVAKRVGSRRKKERSEVEQTEAQRDPSSTDHRACYQLPFFISAIM